MRYIITIAALSALLSACEKDPESTRNAGKGFDVEKLFTVDNCTVYRFYDARTVYFTNCNGSTQWQEGCGKACTEDVNVNGGGQNDRN
jgi:hypothetical protein